MQLSLEQDEKDDDDCLVMIDKQLETGRDPEIEFLGELQSTYSSNLLPESTPQRLSIRVPAMVNSANTDGSPLQSPFHASPTHSQILWHY